METEFEVRVEMGFELNAEALVSECKCGGCGGEDSIDILKVNLPVNKMGMSLVRGDYGVAEVVGPVLLEDKGGKFLQILRKREGIDVGL